MAEIVLTEAQNGTTCTAHIGDTITVRLPENPTTGFLWALDGTLGTSLAMEDAEFSGASLTRMGSGGTRTFTLRAGAAGTASLRLRCARTGDKDAPTDNRFAVTIDVTG